MSKVNIEKLLKWHLGERTKKRVTVPKFIRSKGMLIAKAKADSSTSSKPYILTIAFDVEVSGKKSAVCTQRLTSATKKRIYVEPLSATSRVLVRCTCPDFKFTYSVPLYEKGALYGEPFEFVIAKKPTRKPRNPDNRYGCCNHLATMIKLLDKQELFYADLE